MPLRGDDSSWRTPFEQGWPEPVEDLRARFGLLDPDYTPRELARFTALLVAIVVIVVVALELLG